MPTVLNALQLKAQGGRPQPSNYTGTLVQPSQFLSRSEKDDEWGAAMLDWLEWQGYSQLERSSRAMISDYKLAAGIIDRQDYIPGDDNEVSDLINQLTSEDVASLPLRFFPLVPNILHTMCTEFAKRSDKLSYMGTDDQSTNEMLAAKQEQIEHSLISWGEQQLLQKMLNAGMDPDSEEAQQQLSPENIKTLPEIEQFFSKSYKSLVEQWAAHQHRVDVERFSMHEQELTGFRDMLVTDKEFWHLRMLEDDYEVELWNPVLTFYQKSPEKKYVSGGNYVGNFSFMSATDVIDAYGYMMTADQIRSLEDIRSGGYTGGGAQYLQAGQRFNDGSFYDKSKSHKWNTDMPSLQMRQYQAVTGFAHSGGDWLENILNDNSGGSIFHSDSLSQLRVMTTYWKSVRKLYYLTTIDEMGMPQTEVVDEEYKITHRPVYNTTLSRQKTIHNLISGDHLEELIIPEAWSGLKISANQGFTPLGSVGGNGLMDPIYLNVKPLKFQFKGEHSLYGCKLPVEGCRFSERNAQPVSFCQRLKPPQVGFNLVNNQITDLLIDEQGTVVVLDQNALPQHSMGEDWGKGNYAKAYTAMRDFSILPLDTSIANTENAINFQHYQTLDLSQTQRLLGRIQLATYFKQQAFEAVGITPQRMGEVSSQETATGVEQAVTNSYAQTEMYFIQHSEHLMPRFHQMRTDLAQYYHSTKPSVRLQYMSSEDEKVNFEINGYELLTRDLNITASCRFNTRAMMDQLKQLALNNNTSGASLYDLSSLVKAQSMAEIDNAMKAVENKMERQRSEDAQQQQTLEKMRQEGEDRRFQAEQDREDARGQADRDANIEIAQIRASAMTGAQDFNADGESDYIDTLQKIDKMNANQEANNIKRESLVQKAQGDEANRDLKRQELQQRAQASRDAVAVAKMNKNKYDKPASSKK